MRSLLHDFRFAWRALRGSPGHSLAVIATMALGIGSATAIFAIVYGVLLRPLPFAGAERVAQICEISQTTSNYCVASPPNVADLARGAATIEAAGVTRGEAFVLEDGGRRYSVRGAIATPGVFRALAIEPAMGRVLADDDLPKGSNQVAVISHAFWQQQLGGAPEIVGRLIRLDGRDVRVIGVLQADQYMPPVQGGGLRGIDVWKPVSAGIDNADNRSWRGFMAFVRAGAGVSRTELTRELAARYAQLGTAYPAENTGWTLRVDGLRERVTASIRPTLWLFQAAVGLVLLIACANVASLVIARGTAREAEFAIRASLGAGRARILRQLVAEGLLLSLAGGLLGLPLSGFATRAFVGLAPRDIPRLGEVGIDAWVAVFAIAIALVTAVLFGLVPARRHWGRPTGALRSQRHGGRTRLRSTLVVAELALALSLFVGASLTLRAYGRLSAWEPGFDRQGLTVTWMLAPTGVFKEVGPAVEALTRARQAAAVVPGVVSAGLASAGPLFGGEETGELRVLDRTGDEGRRVTWFDVDEHYFDALGMKASMGRLFTTDDRNGSPQVAVINEALARQVFGGENPIGRRVAVGKYVSEVVGVVPTLTPAGPDRPAAAEIFWPLRQYRRYAAYLVLRLGAGAGTLEPAVRARVAEAAPEIQLTPFTTVDTMFARTLVSPRFNLWLIGAFAAVAVALAAIGIYGIVAFAVGSRTREIGVRLALGATPQRVTAEFVWSALRLIAIGGATGVILSLGLARWFSSLLSGVPATDWPVLGGALAGFSMIAVLAGYLPARRASRVDPLHALRVD